MRKGVWKLAIGIAMLLLTACGSAPQVATTTSAPAATAAAAAPSAAATAAGSAATTISRLPVPQSAFTDHPNDATQARLRLAHLVLGPNVDLFVNGEIAVNGGKAQINMPAGYINGYLFLAPATYSVAVVPTGKSLDQALLGPLDVTVTAGHRYTLAMIGQLKDKSIKPLIIDETTAEQQLGAKSTDTIRIMVNNLEGVAGIDVEVDGKMINTNIPYGGFAAGIYPAGITQLQVLEHGTTTLLWERATRGDQPSSSRLVGIAGQYTAGGSQDWQLFVPTPTSQLNLIDFLHSYSGKKVTTESNPTNPATFETFLAAIEKAGLTETLANGGPYLVVAPTDETFAALPKGQLDTLMASPQAIGDLVRNHIVEGYVPRGSLQDTPGGNAIERPFTNLLGVKMTIGADFAVNGVETGGIESTFVANGSHVHPIYKVLLPATSPVNPLVGTWQRTNSCKSFVQAFQDAGLIDLAPDWLAGGGYFSSPDKIDKTDMCKGANEVKHSHFFTAAGGFGSRDDTGVQVDDGHYTVVDDHTIAFDNKMKVQYRIDGDTAVFTVIPPSECTGDCRQDYAWANAAFYPGPFQRVR
jgi:uncharacterized surface protein with fasciclin (FAS1) repeats